MNNADNYLKSNSKNLPSAVDEMCSQQCLGVELAVLKLFLCSLHRPIDELQLEEVLAVLQEATRKIALHHSDRPELRTDIFPNPEVPEGELRALLPV